MNRLRIKAALLACLALPVLGQDLPPCTIDTIGGGGSRVFGDGAPALEAELLAPADVQEAPDGSLWISDAGQHVIRRIGPDGVIRTMVGNGRRGFSGDGGRATEAQLDEPRSVVFAPDGTLYFYDDGNQRIRRVDPRGVITTAVGSGQLSFASDDTAALEAGLRGTVELALDPAGELVFSVSAQHRIRRLRGDGRVVTIAGISNPNRSIGAFSGDGGPADQAELDRPTDIAVAPDGSILFVDSQRQRIRRVDPSGMIESPFERAFSGIEIELDGDGVVYLRMGDTISRVSSDGLIEAVAELRDRVSGAPVGRSELTVLPDGRIYVLRDFRVFQVVDGGLEPTAGVGHTMSAGDGGPAIEARFPWTVATAAGPNGEVYFADGGLNRIRVVGADGIVRTFAGTGAAGRDPVDGPATTAKLLGIRDHLARLFTQHSRRAAVDRRMRLEPAEALNRDLSFEIDANIVVAQVVEQPLVAVGERNQLVFRAQPLEPQLGVLEWRQALEDAHQFLDLRVGEFNLVRAQRVDQGAACGLEIAAVAEHEDRVLVLLDAWRTRHCFQTSAGSSELPLLARKSATAGSMPPVRSSTVPKMSKASVFTRSTLIRASLQHRWPRARYRGGARQICDVQAARARFSQ